MNNPTQADHLNRVATSLPEHLVLSNAMSTEQQIREMLTEKHKLLKRAAPILQAVTGIDSAVQKYVEQARSAHLPIPDLDLMEQEAAQAAGLEPRQAGFRVRMERPIMIALAQEALAERPAGMTLHEIMDYLKKHGYNVLSDKTLQGGMIGMTKDPAVFASGLDKAKRKVYRLVKPDQRFVEVARQYRDWRKGAAARHKAS